MDRTLIIAEAGVNHDGSLDKAIALVEASADAGADVVKFQTFKADSLVTASAPKASYQSRLTDAEETQHAMLRKLELTHEQHLALKAAAEARGLEFLSTPFDPASADFLIGLGLKRIKVGSGDMTNAPLLLQLARSGARIVLSTGMANLGEVEDALSVLAFGYTRPGDRPSRSAFASAWADASARSVLTQKVMLLHCTTEYPCPPEDANLSVMATLRAAFGLPVGFSDHCVGATVAVAAVALGARVIEKHLTLDSKAPGPDHAASMEPGDFAAMVAEIRTVERAMGDGIKMARPSELPNVPIARKSLVAATDLADGHVLTEDDIRCKRPGTGRPPIQFWDLVGTRILGAKKAGDLL